MAIELDVQDLSGLGFSDQEIQTVLSGTNPRERTRLLRARRGRLLEEIHTAQQRLDRLDYCIYQLRDSRTTRSGRSGGKEA